MVVIRITINKKNAKKIINKGFTLVELIVVILVLGVLAGIAAPALVGYIDKSKEQAAIAEAKNIQIALQAIASGAYYGAVTGTGNTSSFTGPLYGNAKVTGIIRGYSTKVTYLQEVNNLTGMKLTKDNFGKNNGDEDNTIVFTQKDQADASTIRFFRYISDDGTVVVYNRDIAGWPIGFSIEST